MSSPQIVTMTGQEFNAKHNIPLCLRTDLNCKVGSTTVCAGTNYCGSHSEGISLVLNCYQKPLISDDMDFNFYLWDVVIPERASVKMGADSGHLQVSHFHAFNRRSVFDLTASELSHLIAQNPDNSKWIQSPAFKNNGGVNIDDTINGVEREKKPRKGNVRSFAMDFLDSW